MLEATDRKNGRFQSTWDFPPADHKPKSNHTFSPEDSNTYIYHFGNITVDENAPETWWRLTGITGESVAWSWDGWLTAQSTPRNASVRAFQPCL